MCDCISKVNGLLAEHNTKIELPIIGPRKTMIMTMKVNEKKRGKPALMFASYCPFCGEQYEPAKVENTNPADSRLKEA